MKLFLQLSLVVISIAVFCYSLALSQEKNELTIDTIKAFIADKVSDESIANEIKEKGIAFRKIEDFSLLKSELISIGITDDLLNIINGEWEKYAAERTDLGKDLIVTTDPSGATVYLDGIELGNSKENGLELKGLKPKTYQITAIKPGYTKAGYEVSLENVKAGKRLKVKITLATSTLSEDDSGILMVNSTPWSVVYINEIAIGYTPKKVRLLEGSYKIVLRRTDDYEPYFENITIRKGEEKTIPGRLQAR